MPVRAGQIHGIGINRVFVVFVSAAIVAGLAIGYGTNIEMPMLFSGIVLANVVLAGYLVLIRNLIGGLVVYLYSLIFLNYYWRILLPGVWPDIDLPRMMFAFVWLIFILELLLDRRRLLPGGTLGVLMVLILCAFTLSMLTLGKRGIRTILNGYLIPYAMFTLCKTVFVDRRSVERFVFWLAVPLALYFPAMSILEHYRVEALLFPRYIGKVIVEGESLGLNWGGRAMGTFIQPAVTGCAMVMIFFVAVHCLSWMKGTFAKLYSILLFLITPIGVFFTYTRSVFLGFVLGLIIMTAFSKRLRLPAAILLIVMGLAVMGNWSNVKTAEREAGGVGDMATAQGRVVLMNASLRMFMDHPFFGVGFKRFMEQSAPYVSQVKRTFLGYKEGWIGQESNQHNQFSSVLTEIGLVGFVPFVLMYVFLLRMLARARFVKAKEYDWDFVVMVWSVLASYMSVIMFIEPRWFEFLNVLPFMFMGIVAGGYERAIMRRSSGRPGNAVAARKEYAA